MEVVTVRSTVDSVVGRLQARDSSTRWWLRALACGALRAQGYVTDAPRTHSSVLPVCVASSNVFSMM